MAQVGSMIRAVHEITIGAAKATEKRDRQLSELGFQEIDLQYQLPIQGEGTDIPVFDTVEINFEWEFHYAPAQRDSDLEVPHMTYGAYLTDGSAGIFANVKSWKANPANDGITGCTIQVGAIGNQNFAGWLHVTFQGFAMSRDDLSDNPDLEV